MSGGQLYFAFGSNLDHDQMMRRCPGARRYGVGKLYGYRIVFSGYSKSRAGAVATIERARGAELPGVLYSLSFDDLRNLDAYEGHPTFYRRRPLPVVDHYGTVVAAQVYILDDGEKGVPGTEYLRQIADAYKCLGFDVAELLRQQSE